MTKRERIFKKFGGLCAYSGTPLESDWQIEHIKPVVRNPFSGVMAFKKNDNFENMVPVQKIINHYKHSLSLHEFRTWLLGGLHERLKKLPRNPVTEKSKKRKGYLLKVAGYFGITPENPFSGKFYFEEVEDENKKSMGQYMRPVPDSLLTPEQAKEQRKEYINIYRSQARMGLVMNVTFWICIILGVIVISFLP